MILQKTTTFLITITLFFILVFSYVLNVSAQTESNQALICPVESQVSSSFVFNSAEPITVLDTLDQMVLLSNQSSYTFGGVRLGVGIYDSKNPNTAPDFWAVVPGVFTLESGEQKEYQLNLKLDRLPAGKYLVKVFATQGNETAVLGKAIYEGVENSSIQITKAVKNVDSVTMSAKVNNKFFGGETIVLAEHSPINAEITTVNNNPLPLLGKKINTIITQGEIPLGTAVRLESTDTVKLIPKGERVTKVQDTFTEAGKYTLYATIADGHSIQPLLAVPIIIGDEKDGKNSWSYVSRVGLSDYPLQNDSEVVVCINHTGLNENTFGFVNLLGTNFAVSSGQDVLMKKSLTSLDAGIGGSYFTFQPQLELNDFNLQIELLEQRFSNSSTSTVSSELLSSMSVVEKVEMSFGCADNKPNCDDVAGLSGQTGSNHGAIPQKPFWFYAGIVIAASLLMYLMLRRLPPENNGSIKKSADIELS